MPPQNNFDLVEILEKEVYPLLIPEQIYDWSGHDFKRSGRRMRGNPPWGQSKSGSSFTAYDDLGFFDSHNGGETGDPVKYRYSLKIGRYEYPRGRDWIETIKELFELGNVPFPEREWTPQQLKQAQRREARQSILKAVQEYCQQILWSERGAAARKHLIEERGFTEEGLWEFGIGLYPAESTEVVGHLHHKEFDMNLAQEVGVLASKWEGYMIFPWSNPYSQPLTLYGHQSKDWAQKTGKPKKYALFNPKNDGEAWLHTKESPYLFNRAIRDRHKELVLVEGITDAAIAHQQGDSRVIGCVAAMLSKDQIETLKRHRIERVIIVLDPDEGGVAGVESCIKNLMAAGITPYVAPKLPDGLDPDEFILKYGMEGWKPHIAKNIHGFKWKAQKIVATGDLTTDGGKDAVLRAAIAYVQSQQDHAALEMHFLPTIAEALGVNTATLLPQLQSSSKDSGSQASAEENPKHQAQVTTNNLAETSSFKEVIKTLTAIEAIQDKALRHYEFTCFRKQLGISRPELSQIWQLSKLNERAFAPIDVLDFIGQNPESREWLIPRFIPRGSRLVWYADGGTGKTLLAYDAVRCMASGQDWLGGSVRRKHRCLIIQTEESQVDTRERLIINGYLEQLEPGYCHVETWFSFFQIDELAEYVKENEIEFVMIDSLTTANGNSGNSENDVAYSMVFSELKQKVVDPFNCTVLVIHHASRNNQMRGSTANKNNVDFVVHLHNGATNPQEKLKDDRLKLKNTERILEIEKARGGVLGKYIVELLTFDYRWVLVGAVDGFGNRTAIDSDLAGKLQNHLTLNPHRKFSTKDISSDFPDYPSELIRSELEVLRRIGEIKGSYTQAILEDGTKFGYWKYYVETEQIEEIEEEF